jgi:hypothetical protein
MAEASTLKIVIFFGIWYMINVVYNDMNKTVLKVLDLPWTMAALQLGLGLLYVGPLWLTGLKQVWPLFPCARRGCAGPALASCYMPDHVLAKDWNGTSVFSHMIPTYISSRPSGPTAECGQPGDDRTDRADSWTRTGGFMLVLA